MQLCFRRTYGHAQLVADLFVSPAFDIVQHQYRAGTRRQQSDGALELIALGGAERCLAGIGQLLVIDHAYRIRAACTYIHQCDIDGKPVQPGTEGAFVAEIRQLLPGAHESVLGQIFRSGVVIAGQPKNRAMHAAYVQVIQPLERAPVARGCRTNVITVVG